MADVQNGGPWRVRFITGASKAKAAVQAAVAKFGRIDVLINNAGVGLMGVVEESGAPRKAIAGCTSCGEAWVPVMKRRGPVSQV